MVLAPAALLAAAALAAPGPKAAGPMFPPVAEILGERTVVPLPGYASKAPMDFESLVSRLHSGDPAMRKQAVQALGAPQNIRAVPYLGAVVLQLNETLDIRVAAAMALGRIRNWRSAIFLRQSLRDSSREVRFASALALGQCKSRDEVRLLGGALLRDPDWWVRFAAAVALGDDRDPKAVAALARAADGDREWQVRMQAVRSLGQIGSRQAVHALARPLRDPDESVRAATAMTLGDVGGVDAVSLLAEALHAETRDFPRSVMQGALRKLLARP